MGIQELQWNKKQNQRSLNFDKQNASLYKQIYFSPYRAELFKQSAYEITHHIASIVYLYFHHVFQFSIDWISPFQILEWWKNLFFRNPFEIIWFKLMNGNSNEYFTVFFFKWKLMNDNILPRNWCVVTFFISFFSFDQSIHYLLFLFNLLPCNGIFSMVIRKWTTISERTRIDWRVWVQTIPKFIFNFGWFHNFINQTIK